MANTVVSPTHFRLLSALRAIGPYLRETESGEGEYLFDCLAVCVNDKKSPEDREFWGWWMVLEAVIREEQVEGFVARFHMGCYDIDGTWNAIDVPKKAMPEVVRTQEDFIEKLTKVLEERFELAFTLHQESIEFV